MVFILVSCGIYFAIFSVGSSAIRPDPGWWCLTSKFLRAQSQVQGPGDGVSKETAEVEWRWKSLASRRSRSFNHLLIHSFNEFLLRTLMRPSVCENGKGNGIPLQYSCLDNPMDGGAWWAAVHGVTKSQTWLSNFTFTFHFHALEKEMATHSSVLAWRIPGMGSHRVGHYWSDLAVAAAVCEKLHRWTGRPGMLWFMGSQRVGHHLATELNWTHGGQQEDLLLISAPESLTGYLGVKYTNTAIISSGDCSVRKCSDRAGTLTQPGVTRKADVVLRLNLFQ